MRVLVNGRPVREYAQGGMTFIESRHGSNYTIRIKNDNAFKVMAVVSVDGLDVITGKPAEKTNKGYIVDAYSSTEIKGYRLSDEKSVDFVFVAKDGSKNYVAQSEEGDKRNSGVIGIRVFQEKPEKVKVIEKTKVIEKHIHHNHYPYYPKYPWSPAPTYPPQPYWYSSTTYTTSAPQGITLTGGNVGSGMVIGSSTGGLSNSIGATTTGMTLNAANLSYTCANNVSLSSNTSAGGGQSANAAYTSNVLKGNVRARSVSNEFDKAISYDSFDTGTGWGKEKTDIVKKEVFRRGKVVAELVLYYATTDALLGMGVDLTETPKIAEVKAPKAFGDSGYCQPPKNWRG